MTGAGQRQATFCATLVDEWVEMGLEHVVLCPGSRSTPMVLALAAREDLQLHVRLDERSAAFVALGIARATRRPVGMLVTSGTAAAELFAAVCEADLAHLPLLLLTADRPPELQGVGAPQAMEQRNLFGSHVRASLSVDQRGLEPRTWRSLAAEAYGTAAGSSSTPGPVQLNLMLSDPLVGEAGALPVRGTQATAPAASPASGAASTIVEALSGRRVLLLAGEAAYEATQLAELAAAMAWPLVADPRSGLRGGRHAVICAADLLVRDLPAELMPEAVLRVGSLPASKAVGQLLRTVAEAGGPMVLLDHLDRPSDPDRIVTERQHGDLGRILVDLAAQLAPSPPGWTSGWLEAEVKAQAAIDELLGDGLSEPAVARALSELEGVELVVSSSMPIRDLEAFGRASGEPLRVHANRGVNGIDGVTSTAIGVAIGSGRPTVLLTGDLAFLHDASALVDGASSASLDVVVVDNLGGGIFSFLPQHETFNAEHFERFFGTPPRASVGGLARGCGHELVEPANLDELRDGLQAAVGQPGLRVWRVGVPSREENLALHRRLAEAVAKALVA